MIHLKLFEEHNNYLDIAQIDLVLAEEAPLYKSFEIYLNNRKAGILDVGFYKESLRKDEGEIVGIHIDENLQGGGLGRLAIKRLFDKFPNINYFLAMPTKDSIGFWESIGAKYYEDEYVIINRGSI